jgi:hypothetical protein
VPKAPAIGLPAKKSSEERIMESFDLDLRNEQGCLSWRLTLYYGKSRCRLLCWFLDAGNNEIVRTLSFGNLITRV